LSSSGSGSGLLFSGHVTVVPRTLEPFPVALTRRILISQENAVVRVWRELWSEERGQDVAEYAVMLAVILVIAVGTMQLIGVNASNVFSQIGSAIP
jgi:Flp pilus assembly pilin Flp